MTIRRLHVLPQATIQEAARFITGALLLSHGVRQDTAALVRVGGRWLLAEGPRVRRLTPDADTSEGWVRAALRGARVGAVLLDSPPEPLGSVVVVEAGDGSGLARVPMPPVTLCYGSCPEGWRPEVRLSGFGDAWRSVVVANIVLDRIEEGLEGCG